MSNKNYVIVVIDDERTPPQLDGGTVLLYKTSKDGLAALHAFRDQGVQIDELWLDHDLGYDKTAKYGWDTIMPVVTWLEALGHYGTPFNVRYIFIHTANVAAAPAMIDALRPYYTTMTASLPLG